MTEMSVPSFRVAIVGDSGVGKSTLVRRIVESCFAVGGGSPESPGRGGRRGAAFDGGGGGGNLDACLWPSAEATKPVFLEFVDVTGNRTYCPESRRPFLTGAQAIVLMCAQSSDQSHRGLYHWYHELDRFGLIAPPRGVPVLVLRAAWSSGDADVLSPRNVARSSSPPPRAWDAITRAMSTAWSAVERVSVLILSVALFGPFQTVVPWHDPRSAEAAITAITDAPPLGRGSRTGGGGGGALQQRSTIPTETIIIGDPGGFLHSREELYRFLVDAMRSQGITT